MTLFLTTHNTDFAELRGWQQPDGIWSTEHRAFGGMRPGAYQPGQGVDVREIDIDPETFTAEIPSTVIIGGFVDVLGNLRTGFVPRTPQPRATAGQKAEFLALEKKLGRSFITEEVNAFREKLRAAQAERTGASSTLVWLVLTPTTKMIGDYRRNTSIINAVYSTRAPLDAAVTARRREQPDAPALKFVAVHLDQSFDLHQLAASEATVTETLPVELVVIDPAVDRYTQLRAELGL